MKVLVLSHMYPYTANAVYGIFVHQQARTLRDIGVDVRVVVPVPWTPWPLKHLKQKWRMFSEVEATSVLDGICIYYPRYVAFPQAWGFASSGKRMYKGVKDLFDQIYREYSFDLLHAHVALPDGYAGALITRKLGIPLIITVHGQDLQHTIHRRGKCLYALSNAFNNASRVIVVSQKLKGLAEKYFNLHNKLIVIPNGINMENLMTIKQNISEWNDKEPILLSVSNLEKIKGIDLNLRAFHKLIRRYPTLRYIIIGSGPEEKKLKKLSTILGINDRVSFLGLLPHQQVMKHMAMCDIFTLPSWNEGLGIVYLEAMAHEKPVIAVRGQGIDGIINQGENGMLVKPRDVDSLVEALDFFLSHPEKARKIGERARKLVLENYTWRKNADKTLHVYHQVLDKE